ncbi:ATP-binding protein [Streptomyces sp. NPDC058254]|uniref:ATP-binding protein n=1 Tax=Streptomyces sp. NPDC058254 TaxID=3346406 RepID=UPI0036E6289D
MCSGLGRSVRGRRATLLVDGGGGHGAFIRRERGLRVPGWGQPPSGEGGAGCHAWLSPSAGAEAESVLLVVTELVTNAVRHAGGLTGFGLRAGQGTVTVSVEDASRMPPQPRPTDPTRPGGFGWPLVQSLALDVQVSGRRGGKTVSAMLPFSH